MDLISNRNMSNDYIILSQSALGTCYPPPKFIVELAPPNGGPSSVSVLFSYTKCFGNDLCPKWLPDTLEWSLLQSVFEQPLLGLAGLWD